VDLALTSATSGFRGDFQWHLSHIKRNSNIRLAVSGVSELRGALLQHIRVNH
jgi:hypothetical protein